MKLLAPLGAVLLLGIMILSGVGVLSGLALVALLALQVLAGVMVWRWLAGPRPALDGLSMGAALGSGLSLLSGVVLHLIGGPTWSWCAFPAVVLGVAAIRWLRQGRGESGAHQHTVWWGLDGSTTWALAIGVALGLGFIVVNLRNYPLTWTGSWSGYHPDMPFFEALSESMAKLGPLNSIFLPGGQVRYHWLAYGWAGQLTVTSGAEPFVVLTRLLPAFAMLAGVGLVVSWARRASQQAWVPSLAAVLLVTGGFLGAVYGGVFNFDSPSQSTGVVWLVAYSIALLTLLGSDAGPRRRVWWVVLLGVLSLLITGAKVSAALPLLVGVCAVAVVALVRRETWSRAALLSAGSSVVGSGLAYVLILAGASGSGGLGVFDLMDRASSQQGLNPVDGLRGVVLGTAILIVAMVARWTGIVWLGVDRSTRWAPMTVFGLGLAASGVSALVVFNGFNEIWFGLAASAPLCVITAVGAGAASSSFALAPARSRRGVLLACIAAAIAVFVVVFALWATGASGGNTFVGTLRWLGPLVGFALCVCIATVIALWSSGRWRISSIVALSVVILVFTTTPGRFVGAGTGIVGQQDNGLRREWLSFGYAPVVKGRDVTLNASWSASQMSAAAWLRKHAGQEDMLATNMTFGPFVPGVTGLPTYVSAIQYQAPYGLPVDAQVLLKHEAQVWDFIDRPSSTTAKHLCDAGVSWLWVDPRLTQVRSWEPFATNVMVGQDVVIAHFGKSCGSRAR